jgi:hypothetical protein
MNIEAILVSFKSAGMNRPDSLSFIAVATAAAPVSRAQAQASKPG